MQTHFIKTSTVGLTITVYHKENTFPQTTYFECIPFSHILYKQEHFLQICVVVDKEMSHQPANERRAQLHSANTTLYCSHVSCFRALALTVWTVRNHFLIATGYWCCLYCQYECSERMTWKYSTCIKTPTGCGQSSNIEYSLNNLHYVLKVHVHRMTK